MHAIRNKVVLMKSFEGVRACYYTFREYLFRVGELQKPLDTPREYSYENRCKKLYQVCRVVMCALKDLRQRHHGQFNYIYIVIVVVYRGTHKVSQSVLIKYNECVENKQM